MFFRLLLPLSRVVRREINNWRNLNEEYRRARGSRIERKIYVSTASFPRLFSRWLLIVAFLMLLAIAGRSYTPWPVSSYFRMPQDTLERLLTLQATLAALTYPIVLALIRILFQRSWTDLRVQVYLAYSGALLAGASALLAIAAIASFVVLVQGNVSPFVNAIAKLTFLAWFLTNIALTANFIYRSLRYLDPPEQQRSLLLYTVTTIWPNELRRRLMQLRLRHAPDLDWPPNANNTQIPSVDVSPITLRGETHEVRIESPTPRWLSDVWLRPLRFVARSWQTRCVASVDPQSESGMSADHWLIFPMSYGSSQQPPFDLCRRRGHIGLKPYERWVVSASFRLTRRTTPSAIHSVVSIADELGDIALTELQADRKVTFRQALTNLLEFHRSVILLGDDPSSHPSTNYLTMEENPYGSLRSLDSRLLEPYRRIATLAISRHHDEQDYLRMIVNCASSLLSSVRNKAPIEIRQRLQAISTLQWHALHRHWLGRTPEHFEARSSSAVGEIDAGTALERDHTQIVKTLCGAWDEIPFQLLCRDDFNADWPSLGERARECVHHLELTVRHVFSAFASGDPIASRWALDLLQRWPDYWFDVRHAHADLQSFPQLGEGAFYLRWSVVEQVLRVDGEAFPSTAELQKAILSEALLNSWRDACTFLMTWLLHQSTNESPRQQLALSLHNALHTGEILVEAGSIHDIRRPTDHIDDAFAAWLRSNLWNAGEDNITGQITDRLNRAATDSLTPTWVMGRGYSTQDDQTDRKLAELALVHLVSQTEPSTVIGKQISDALVIHVEQDAVLFERAVSQLRETKTRVSDLDMAQWLPVLRILSPSKSDADHRTAQRHLAEQLDHLLEAIHARHDERLETAEIDPAHIERITEACVRHAFSREHGAVPLPYFDEIEFVDDELPETACQLPNRKKAELVHPPLATTPANQDEWYVRSVPEYVARDVRQRIREQLDTRDFDSRNEYEFADQLIGAARELRNADLEPLLFVAERRDLYGRWTRRRSRIRRGMIGELLLTTREGSGEPGYLAHVGDIPAIAMPMVKGSAFMLPMECFSRIEFKRQHDGRPARLNPRESYHFQIGLYLEWSVRVVLRELPAFRFIFEYSIY